MTIQKPIICFKLRAVCAICLSFWFTPLAAQERDTLLFDSNYVISYPELVVGRVFLVQKYTILNLDAAEGIQQLQYRPNTTVNLGVGATYRAISLNISYGFNFLNQDTEKGDTKYLDLQTHLYGTKWRYDFYGQFYKGYYLYPRGLAAPVPETYYIRPDVRVREFGFHAYYIFNHRRYSYRAAFLQNDWQKKSAGSFLAGGGISYATTSADSPFVPQKFADNYSQKEVNSMRYFKVGPGAAYAYTLVIKEHFYVMASFTVSLDFGITEEKVPDDKMDHFSIYPNFLVRAVTGYNSDNFKLNLSWITSRNGIKGSFPEGYNINTGIYRLTFSKSFIPGKGLKKVLKGLDRILNIQ